MIQPADRPIAVSDALRGVEVVETAVRCGETEAVVCLPAVTTDPIVNAYLEGRAPNDYMLQLMLETTLPGDRVVDLGCHVGTFSIGAAATGRVVFAVDASPLHVALIERSRALNRFDDLGCHWRAIDASRASVRIVESGIFSRVVDDQTPGAIDVPASTMDAFASEHITGEVAFVKMDIEGAELAAIRSGRSFFETSMPVILFESNGMTLKLANSSVDELRGAMEELGYQVFRIEGDRWIHSPVGEVQPEGWVDMIALGERQRRRWAGRIDSKWEPEAIFAKCLAWSQLPHANTRQYLLEELRAREFDRSIEAGIADIARQLETALANP